MPTATRTLAYEIVDVFTDRPFAGNPLAVVLDADDLSTRAMQQLAAEFGLSETVFPVVPPAGADYALRIFTPSVELPFAGHPSVGAAWVLHRLGRLRAGDVVQSCAAGLLAVHVGADHAAGPGAGEEHVSGGHRGEGRVVVTGGTPRVGPPLEAGALLAAVGLDAADLRGRPRRAGCGTDFTYLLVDDAAVARCRPDAAALAALELGTGIFVTSWVCGAAHARMFAPGAGVAEDPATGSAAVALGPYLAAEEQLADGPTAYVVSQGAEIGRPSTMHCTVEVSGGMATVATVGGSVVPVARGEVRVPG